MDLSERTFAPPPVRESVLEDRRQRGDAGPPGLGSNPMPATSWLCDIWGYLLPRHTLCKTCGLTLQISAQDLTVWAGSGGWLDFALSHQLSCLYGARSAKTASHAVRDQGAVSGSLSSSLLGLPHTSGSGSPKGGIPSCQSLLDEGEDVSAISQGEKRLAQCVCVWGGRVRGVCEIARGIFEYKLSR